MDIYTHTQTDRPTNRWMDRQTDILHHAAEMVNISVLQLHLKVKRLAHTGPARHSGKVDGGYGIKLDVDGWFVDKDESFIQGVEVA